MPQWITGPWRQPGLGPIKPASLNPNAKSPIREAHDYVGAHRWVLPTVLVGAGKDFGMEPVRIPL